MEDKPRWASPPHCLWVAMGVAWALPLGAPLKQCMGATYNNNNNNNNIYKHNNNNNILYNTNNNNMHG